jgi:hypothetical protein
MRKNVSVKNRIPYSSPVSTHEGAPAKKINALQQLRRTVMSCLLWEDSFYESGESIADRLKNGIALVKPAEAYSVALEARQKYFIRHAPLLIAREMARLNSHKSYVGSLLPQIINRADELSEFLALYWADNTDKKQPLSNQVKKGLAQAFIKFGEYELAKWNRDSDIKLRDVLFMVHPKPVSPQGDFKIIKKIDPQTKKEVEVIRHLSGQGDLWSRLVEDKLEIPFTWETKISAAGSDPAKKKAAWEEVIEYWITMGEDGKVSKVMNHFAILRNLRNIKGLVSPKHEEMIMQSFYHPSWAMAKLFPYRFIAASRFVPAWEPHLEYAMMSLLSKSEKLLGKTIILVDVSGSMNDTLSSKSEMLRLDAAYGLAILAREICERAEIYSFSSHVIEIPARRGFALRDAINTSQQHSSTYLGAAVEQANKSGYDRVIVITDEQSHDAVPNPNQNGKGYMINVAAYENGVGYGPWTHIDGWSDASIKYIQEVEKSGLLDE